MNTKELLESKNIPYTPRGKDYVIKCLNPEHDDSNPSMRVDQITGIFNCFSCGYKGNLFTHFGQKANGMQLKREFLKRKIQKVRAESVGLQLPAHAVPYIGDWRGIKPATYDKFGAFNCETDGMFSGRINFPIYDLTGNIVAFVGRHTTGGVPKYLNSPPGAKMPLFPKVNTINSSVILVEGIYDMLNLHDKGLTNAVCCFGVKNVTEEKLNILTMQGVDRIDIFLDNDEAGQLGAKKIEGLCQELGIVTNNIKFGDKNIDAGALTQAQVDKLKSQLY